MKGTDNFWDFSVSTYRQPGVAEACLSLQDRFGCDVNVLLYCCWFGCTRGLMIERTFNAALSFSEPWANEVVRPLRTARTWMKIAGCGNTDVSTESCMSLRDDIKAAELKAEHLQQDTLERLTSTPLSEATDPQTQMVNTACNLRKYLNYYDIRLDGPSLAELAHIVAATIDDTDQKKVIITLADRFSEELK